MARQKALYTQLASAVTCARTARSCSAQRPWTKMTADYQTSAGASYRTQHACQTTDYPFKAVSTRTWQTQCQPTSMFKKEKKLE
eukprot:595317-Amphidinium_carterae.1